MEGFEPSLTEPESVVLPLHHISIVVNSRDWDCKSTILRGICKIFLTIFRKYLYSRKIQNIYTLLTRPVEQGETSRVACRSHITHGSARVARRPRAGKESGRRERRFLAVTVVDRSFQLGRSILRACRTRQAGAVTAENRRNHRAPRTLPSATC